MKSTRVRQPSMRLSFEPKPKNAAEVKPKRKEKVAIDAEKAHQASTPVSFGIEWLLGAQCEGHPFRGE